MLSLCLGKLIPTSVTGQEEPLCWGILGLLGKVGNAQGAGRRDSA